MSFKSPGNCQKCGTFRRSRHRDHIIPRYKGGGDEDSNIQFLCANCHEDKTREDITGRKASPETCAKISAALTGLKRSVETRKRISRAKLGVKFSPEHREKLRLSRLGKKLTAESIEKRSSKLRGRKMSEEQRHKISTAIKAHWITRRTLLNGVASW